MIDAFAKNFIDYEEYPVSADIQVSISMSQSIRRTINTSIRTAVYQ